MYETNCANAQDKTHQYVDNLLHDWNRYSDSDESGDLNSVLSGGCLSGVNADGTCLISIASKKGERSDGKQATKNLKHRALVLSTGIRAAEILLTADDEASIESALTASLELLGSASEADLVHIWRNEMKDGELHFVLSYKWLSDFGKNCAFLPTGLAIPYSDKPEWKKKFLRGEHFSGLFSEMAPEDQAFLSLFDTKSLVVIPLFLQKEFWGFVSLIDCRNERAFPEDELNILRWVCLMIASAVNRSAGAAQLREAHERTRLLLDAMPLSCHLWNRDYKMFDSNDENVRLFDIKDKREIIDDFYKYSPEYQPDGRHSSDAAAEALQIAFDKGRHIINWAHQLSDGTPIPTEVTLVRLPYENDYVVAGYARDLREYNKMMEEIEQSKAELEAANNAKSDFLASMSHEMRTPLNAVIGLSGLTLEADGLGEEARENLEKIYNAGSTLLNLVNDILDISKIEAGKFELIPRDYDTPSLINDTVTQNILRLDDKPIKFHLNVSPHLPTRLYGDDLRIKQIISNLLSNALKYTKEGFVELGIECEFPGCSGHSAPSEQNGSGDEVWVAVRVKDTGIGIRPEDMKKLFSDYSQVNMKANRHIEGTGLGLAITKKMLEMMGGTITVESEYEKGSVFTARFIQKLVTDTPIGETVVDNLKSFKYSDDIRNKDTQIVYKKMPHARVLVVDDNITNLEVAKGLMKPYGMTIDCMTSGQEAIAAIRRQNAKYDAIFMDHMMPGMDGITALERIREIGTDYAINVPIIALTANAIAGNDVMFLQKGFQAFLSKPINLMQLDSIIKQWVRDKSRRHAHPNRAKETLNGNAQAQHAHEKSENHSRLSTHHSAQSPTVHHRSITKELPLQPVIPGLDFEKGLSLYGGMQDVYLPVLRSFAENTPTYLEGLRDVTAENLQDYAIIAHGIKGSAAGIGATEVSEKGYMLELMAKSGDLRGVQNRNSAFISEVGLLVENIKAWFANKGGCSAKPRLPYPDPAVLSELRQSLIDYDISGIDCAMDKLEGAEYDSCSELVDWLKSKITISEFELAERRIAEFIVP